MENHSASTGAPARGIATTVLVVAALGASVACRAEEPALEPVIRPVVYEVVYVSSGFRERSFSGVATASTEWNGSFKVAGTVESVFVGVGDSLRPGQLIAQLDAYDYELQVQQAEAGLAQAQANSRNAAAAFERIRELFESDDATQTDYDRSRAADESARQAVRSAQKTLELAQRRRDYATLSAPDAGDIAQVLVDENENVAAGQVVIVMTSGSRPEVTLAIPEALITDIQQGDRVTVTFDALPGRSFPAAVTEVGVSATGMATTFPVTVRLDAESEDVRSGMAADVTFQFETGAGDALMLVPSAAVLEDRAGRFVYVIELGEGGLGTARRREVTVGEITNEGIEVISGLSEGDMVITAGARRIVDGQRVKTSGESAG